MPKRKRRSKIPWGLIVLAVLAVAAFLVGQALILRPRQPLPVALGRFGAGDPARLTQAIGREIRQGLTAAGVPGDSIRDEVLEQGPARLRWRVGLAPDASLLQANYAVTRRVEEAGGTILGGRESPGPGGSTIVTLLAGLPGRATHEIVLVRSARGETPAERPAARLAIVLFGFGDDADEATAFFRLHTPFAVAIAPGTKASRALFKAAHEQSREVVLHLPLEPINFPQMNPGPGTILVTMPPARITGAVRRDLDQAGAVTAVANLMGSLATQDMAVMGAVFRELHRRHVPFVHVQPTPGAVCRAVAAEVGVVYDEPEDVVDAETRKSDTRALDERWKDVLERARKRGQAMVWIRATPTTRAWLARATSRKQLEGVNLVPLSAVIRHPAVL